MNPNPEQTKKAVDTIFSEFDTDKNGTLDRKEVHTLVNAFLKKIGANRIASSEEVDIVINNIDLNKDGKISKKELEVIFTKVAKL